MTDTAYWDLDGCRAIKSQGKISAGYVINKACLYADDKVAQKGGHNFLSVHTPICDLEKNPRNQAGLDIPYPHEILKKKSLLNFSYGR